MTSVTGKCKLCADEQVKLCNSHIIPRFVDKWLVDQRPGSHPSFRSRSLGPPTQVRPLQSTPQEHLLCKKCEGELGKIEERVSEAWSVPDRWDEPSYSFTAGGYADLKLLLLAVLWRSSVASIAMYRSVDLRDHEEDVRSRLLKLDPGPPSFFPVLGKLLVSSVDKTTLTGVLWPPQETTALDLDGWSLAFGGVEFFATPHSVRLSCIQNALPTLGPWNLTVVELNTEESSDEES